MVCYGNINICTSCESRYGMNLATGLCQSCNDTLCHLCSTNYLYCYKCLTNPKKIGLHIPTSTCKPCTDINCLKCH